MAGDTFDAAKAATRRRAACAETAARLSETLTRRSKKSDALLTSEQRQRMAYLIRSGVLSI